MMNDVIRTLTDQRRSHSLDSIGQMKQGIKLIEKFEPETLQFISAYFTRGNKYEWLEQSCYVQLRLRGKFREMILFASSEKRSNIDFSTIPRSCQSHLDESWRYVCQTKKRDVSGGNT